ncbi:hypothetical protein GCM10010166_43490 [Couchioplanes caeruleus subsp. azureus]|nr:hypothetical protein GCM10010166_43490 [Couchioplanes caeruleus subsp. azureus]
MAKSKVSLAPADRGRVAGSAGPCGSADQYVDHDVGSYSPSRSEAYPINLRPAGDVDLRPAAAAGRRSTLSGR